MKIICQDITDIPAIDDIRASVTHDQSWMLVIPFPYTDPRYQELESTLCGFSESLPNHSIFYSGGTENPTHITILKVLDAEVVRSHAAMFLDLIHDYVARENDLVTQLAAALNFPIDQISETWIRHLDKEQMHGTLGEDWTYSFHGLECRFRHTTTGEVVDATLRDYGKSLWVPEPYFLAIFLKTHPLSPDLTPLIKRDFHDMRQVLEVLVHDGYLPNNDAHKG